MNGLPQQIPSDVKYDFFMTLIGLVILSYMIYLDLVLKVVIDTVTYSVILVVGLVFFISGFSEMKNNYFREKEIKTLEYDLREIELRRKLKEFTSDKDKLNR